MFFFVLLWEVRLEREINVNEFFFSFTSSARRNQRQGTYVDLLSP